MRAVNAAIDELTRVAKKKLSGIDAARTRWDARAAQLVEVHAADTARRMKALEDEWERQRAGAPASIAGQLVAEATQHAPLVERVARHLDVVAGAPKGGGDDAGGRRQRHQ